MMQDKQIDTLTQTHPLTHSVAPIHKFANIPIYRFISFCTADTDANTDTWGNRKN